VNDRLDIACLSGASGVHVGQGDLSPREVRSIAGDSFVVGLSTHTSEQVEDAVREPVSHIAIGPVFATTTKDTGYATVGLERVRDVCALASRHDLPVVAIGGITIDRAAAVLAHGASAVAVISDLLATNDPAARVRAYLKRLSLV
jgi:thiamine-phosphate pyrophosphorylase